MPLESELAPIIDVSADTGESRSDPDCGGGVINTSLGKIDTRFRDRNFSGAVCGCDCGCGRGSDWGLGVDVSVAAELIFTRVPRSCEGLFSIIISSKCRVSSAGKSLGAFNSDGSFCSVNFGLKDELGVV